MAASGAGCSSRVGARSSGPGRPTLVIDATGASRTLVIFGGERKSEREGGRRGRRAEGGKRARALSIGFLVPVDPFFRVALIREHRGSSGVSCEIGPHRVSISDFVVENIFPFWNNFLFYFNNYLLYFTNERNCFYISCKQCIILISYNAWDVTSASFVSIQNLKKINENVINSNFNGFLKIHLSRFMLPRIYFKINVFALLFVKSNNSTLHNTMYKNLLFLYYLITLFIFPIFSRKKAKDSL